MLSRISDITPKSLDKKFGRLFQSGLPAKEDIEPIRVESLVVVNMSHTPRNELLDCFEDNGFILKDGTAWNVTYYKGKMIFFGFFLYLFFYLFVFEESN